MTVAPARLLLIDDDDELAGLLQQYLMPQAFQLEAAANGLAGVERAVASSFGLIVLDVMLPDIDGFEVLRRIREQSDTPIIMLTARGDDVDRIVGLELGADDYLPKPFNPRELVARIRAILRRVSGDVSRASSANGEAVSVGDVKLEARGRRVFRGEAEVDLTGAEFDLLELLMRSAGEVVPRTELFRRVLDREPDPFDRSIDMHISHLRKKLGRAHLGVERIKSVRGVGYVYTRPSHRA